MQELTAQRVRELLDYDPDTGVLTWRLNRGGSGKKGCVAGAAHDGRYVRLSVDGRSYKAHRIAFLWMTGRWPLAKCDHRDLDKSNNRWENIREATVSQNGANRGPQANNASGAKGVVWLKRDRKWRTVIKVRGRVIRLGLFYDLQEAKSAYLCAAEKYFGEFARLEA